MQNIVTLNDQQKAVEKWVKENNGSAIVQAYAGTGKTFLLEYLAGIITGKALFCAYNKAIADELKLRLRNIPNCDAATMHSVGLRLFKKLRPHVQPAESRKVRNIVKQRIQFDRRTLDVIVQAVSTAKSQGVGIAGYPHWTEQQTWMDIFDRDEDLLAELPSDFSLTRVYDECIRAYQTSMDQCEDQLAIIDFDDMILAPLVMGGNGSWMEMYDWVMVDEAQDLNETRRLLALRVLRRGGRFVAVGDPNQAIYAFAGANSDSLERIRARVNAVTLPLATTYRCPKTVVELAKTWVPDYEANEENPQGEVRTIGHVDFWHERLTSDDVVLCRYTRPLVGIAKRLRKMDIPCVVEGFSPKGLIALAEKWGDITVGGFIERVTEYRKAEYTRLMTKGMEDKAERVAEKVACLMDLAVDLDNDDPVKRLVASIERLFGHTDDRNRDGVLHLCTVHRSKGREWHRVYLVGRNAYMPSYYAQKSGDKEALQQEQNLMYVAVTRAKSELVEVVVPVKVKTKGQGQAGPQVEWWEL